jgi:hypothetical protein
MKSNIGSLDQGRSWTYGPVQTTLVLALGGLVLCGTARLHADPAEIVAGLSEICSPGAPGPVHPLSNAWWPIVGGDDDTSFPATFIMAREYETGRVLVAGHDGYVGNFNLLNNGALLLNTVAWLRNGGPSSVRYTTGHSEWVTGASLNDLGQALLPLGYNFGALSAPITPTGLTGVGVLIVGNAWAAFTPAEIEAVRQWVAQGGGVWLLGCGWSWEPYHPGSPIEDYPMMKMAGPYELRWLRSGISDPTNNVNGSAIFHTFYPQAESPSLTHAMATIDGTHFTYGAALVGTLESDAEVRRTFVHAHQALAIPPAEFPTGHADRQVVFNYYADLVAREAGTYARIAPFNASAYPTMVWLRERVWRSWHDALTLTPAVKATMATVGQLTGKSLDIFNTFDIVLLDNVRLDAAQKGFLYDYLTLVPQSLHTLRSISVHDFLGTPPRSIPLDGPTWAVNIFGVPIGGASENSFPPDVAPGYVDIFCAATAHEVNHVVDVCTIGPSASLDVRRDQLIADAGEDAMNYLRSMVPSGVFLHAPQEFFASIANEWFTDSAKTVQLGLVRFDAGRPDPINQALFFAEVYSRGGAQTLFYTIDTAGQSTCTSTPLGRNEAGAINWIAVDGQCYFFTLDSEARVLAYQSAPIVRGDLNCDGTYGYLSFGDINPFVLYLSNFTAWQASYPGCPPLNGDINGDGTYGYVSLGDINPFVALLSGG